MKSVIFNPWKGFLQFIRLGVEHILTGYDHILFLITIILPVFLCRQENKWTAELDFKKILVNTVKLITVFTFAHSITLIMAVLGIVAFPAELVESVIALSIAFTALDNYFSFYKGRLWLLVLFFGFFHGLGFANVLAEMGLVQESLIYPLFGFNLGIEAGQLIIFLIVLPVLFLLSRKTFYSRVILKHGSMLIFLIAMYWFVKRIFL